MANDDLMSAWTRLEARLLAQNARLLDGWHVGQRTRAKTALGPLVAGQIGQLAVSAVSILAGVGMWTADPSRALLLAGGLMLHGYGIAIAIAAFVTLRAYRRVDFSAPVIAVQLRLGELRRAHVIGGLIAGLPWLVLWMLPPVLLLDSVDRSAFATTGFTVWLLASFAVGIAILVAIGAFALFARAPGREGLRRRLGDLLGGASLRRAETALAEVRAFEK